MSKQVSFIATEQDVMLIAKFLGDVFGELIVVPFFETDFLPLDKMSSSEKQYLAEERRKGDIIYDTDKDYDGTTYEYLDVRKSPVLEYIPSRSRPDGGLVEGRFYCCSNDIEFSKKASKFLTKLRKEFFCAKKYGIYISRNVDLTSTPLGPIGAELDIKTEDLS